MWIKYLFACTFIFWILIAAKVFDFMNIGDRISWYLVPIPIAIFFVVALISMLSLAWKIWIHKILIAVCSWSLIYAFGFNYISFEMFGILSMIFCLLAFILDPQ